MSLETVATIATILGGVAVLVGGLAAIRRIYTTRRRDKKRSKTISIEITDKLREKNLRYGVLHVRNGRDDDPRTLINEEHYLEKENGNKYSTTIEYVERLGFQFKCFAEYGDNSFNEIKELLKEAGFKSIAQGKQDSQKAWFLLPEYGETPPTREGFVDNYYFPT